MTTEQLFQRYGPRYKWWATVTVLLAAIISVLSATIVNVALPHIMTQFHMSQVKLQWLSTGFLAAMTATMLVNAWLMQAFGQRQTYIWAMALFLFASFLAGFSPNGDILIIGRVLQGAASGILQTLAMYTLFRVFPTAERGRAMGIYGIGVVLAPAVGPTVGGLLVDYFSWRYVFFMAPPLCVAGLLLAPFFLPQREETGPRPPFDWPGFLLLCLALGLLLSGLTHGQRFGWGSPLILGQLAVALLVTAAFIYRETTTPHPMVRVQVFHSLGFCAAAGVALILGAGIYSSTYLIPLFVQTIQGYTPIQSGLLLMPAGIILGFMFPMGGRLTDRVPARIPIIMGLTLFALSCWLEAGISLESSFLSVAGWMLLGRIGLGLAIPALNAGAVRALPPELLSQSSGMINFIRQLGGAFGVNLFSIVLDRRTLTHMQQLLAKPGHVSAEMLRIHANILGYRDSFLLGTVLFLLGIVPALLMRQKVEA